MKAVYESDLVIKKIQTSLLFECESFLTDGEVLSLCHGISHGQTVNVWSSVAIRHV